MSVGFHRLAAIGLLCLSLHARPAAEWRLARSAHFEVYSQAGDETARSTLLWLERLRAFLLRQTGLKLITCRRFE